MRICRAVLPSERRHNRGGKRAGRRGLVRTGGESGYTLVELAIASGIIAVALSVIAGVLTSGVTATGSARQRQTANSLANQALEKVRALPFNTVKAGLDNADLAATAGTTDPSITTTGCGGAYCFGGEQVVHGNNPVVDPIVPHQWTTTVAPTTFKVSTYLTRYQNTTTTDVFRATAIVTWTSRLEGGAAKSVQVQTIIYAPTKAGGDCLSLSVHPFSGPCQPSFNSTAQQDSGFVNIAGTLSNLELDHLTLWSGRATSDAKLEQTSRIEGISEASGATVQLLGDAEQSIGRQSASSAADNDPDTPATSYDTQSLTGTAGASFSVSSGSDSATIATTGGDSGSTTSTTSANTSGSPARNCPNLSGYSNENDSKECGGSSSRTASTVSANATLHTLGSFELASVGPQASPTVAIADRNIAPAAGKCVATSGDGCARSSVTRSSFDMSLAALPSNLNALLKPVGFTTFVQLTGLTDSVTSEAGVGTSAPTASATAGSLRIYCATAILGNLLCPLTGYVTTPLVSIVSQVNVPVLTIVDPLLGGGTTITLSATVTPASSSTISTPTCGGTCTRSSATATYTPLQVSLTYQIVVAGQTRVNVTYLLDPGALRASTSYVAAPTS